MFSATWNLFLTLCIHVQICIIKYVLYYWVLCWYNCIHLRGIEKGEMTVFIVLCSRSAHHLLMLLVWRCLKHPQLVQYQMSRQPCLMPQLQAPAAAVPVDRRFSCRKFDKLVRQSITGILDVLCKLILRLLHLIPPTTSCTPIGQQLILSCTIIGRVSKMPLLLASSILNGQK